MPSKAAIGRTYELLSVKALCNYSFQLSHRGRAGDRGIDFIGSWVLPSKEIRVVGQCKALKGPAHPGHVRELEGTLTAVAGNGGGYMGLLVSRNGFSSGCLETVMSMSHPMALCHLVPLLDQSQERHKADSSVTAQNTSPDWWLEVPSQPFWESGRGLPDLSSRQNVSTAQCKSGSGLIMAFCTNASLKQMLPGLSVVQRRIRPSANGPLLSRVVLTYTSQPNGVSHTKILCDVVKRLPKSGRPIEWAEEREDIVSPT